VKLVHSRTDAPGEVPEELRRALDKLRETYADIVAMKNPFAHLLPPDGPPPTTPLGKRPARVYDELPEHVEAAGRQAVLK
jgi:hypothetical protein